jgi:hypothetical protein
LDNVLILQNLKAAFAIYANFDEGELVEMPIEQLKFIA